jgi:hypothetical protein
MQVNEIRASRSPTRDLVAAYGLSATQIRRIRRGEGWTGGV